jgi:AcrR family transcriptional regulator
MTQKKPNRAVERTKGWIFEALLALLDEKPYQSIGISDISDKAGINRSSFYRNFESKDDVIIQFMTNLVNANMLAMRNSNKKDEIGILTVFLSAFLEHEEVIKNLLSKDLEYLFFSFTDNFEAQLFDMHKDTFTLDEKAAFQYALNFQVGGSIRMVMHWVKADLPLPPDKMAALLGEFIRPFKKRRCSLTDLLVRVKDGGV